MELVFHTTSGALRSGPPSTFKCRYRMCGQHLCCALLRDSPGIPSPTTPSKGYWACDRDVTRRGPAVAFEGLLQSGAP